MPASTSSVPFEGVKTREASLRVSLDVPASRRQTPSTARSDVTSSRPVFNNVLGKLPTTLWQIADQFTPKGLALEVSGDLDEADGHAVYEAAILGDAVAVAQALGVPPPLGKEEEGAAADEAVVPATAQRGPWHVSDAFGIEPLAHAADAGHAAVVKVLLGAAADPRAKCACDGTTALHRAAKSGHSAIVDLLVAHSAAVNEPAAVPHLHLAAMGGHSDAIKSLLTAGADVEAYDATGTTPLMAAAERRRWAWLPSSTRAADSMP